MGTLIGVAFIVGVLTVLTPCVLPVLPVVLAVGPTGSRMRPYAIVAGMVASFTLFTIFWTAILDALPIPPDLLRNIAIAVIAVTALSLLIPKIAEIAARPLEPLGRISPKADGNGFLLGLALGLVFTPCAGLLIGSVVTAAATQQYSVGLFLVVIAYAAGAGLSMLAIMLGVRRGLGMASVRRAAPRIRQAFGVLALGAVVVMALGVDARLAARAPAFLDGPLGIQEADSVASELRDLSGVGEGVVARGTETPSPSPSAVDSAARSVSAGDSDGPTTDDAELRELAARLPDYGLAPEFADLRGWINGAPTTLAAQRGKVVVIDFWAYSCVNCIRTLPHLRRWHGVYADDGLSLIGVHTPEFAFEADEANVERATRDLHVTWPVALDSRFGTWSAWGNQYWPAKYVIDRQGRVRYAHFGEGAYSETERVIRALLAEGVPGHPELPAPLDSPEDEPAFHRVQTPEIYLGHLRAEDFVDDIREDARAQYMLPPDPGPDRVGLGGEWTVDRERALAGRQARLRLSFRGSAVHLVLGPDAQGAGSVVVRLDGRRVRTVRVREHRLYTLAEVSDDRQHLLELEFSPGVAGYAFTFGDIGS